MKFLLLPLALWCALGVASLADPPPDDQRKFVTGADIAANVRLVVRAERGEKLTEDETGRMQLMVAYIKGFTDGLHPLQVLLPQGPVSIPDGITVGEFARHLDEYLTKDPDARKHDTALTLFNCAFLYYPNKNFQPQLMPRRVPIPELMPKK